MTVFHPKRGEKYHRVNSIRGIRKAKRLGYREIDIDMQITLDGIIVGTHWPRPMMQDGFRDPKKRLAPMRTVASMTWAEVSRLVAGRWPRRYRIQRIERLLAECARQGVGAVLEPKGDPRFRLDATWEHLAKVADDLGADVRVYALKKNAATLPVAKRHGFKVKELGK